MSTPDESLRQLDERAAAATAELRARSAERPIPPFDPDRAAAAPLRTAPSGGRGRLLAVAAAVVVLAAVAGLLVATMDDDADTDPAKVVTTEPRPYVVGDLPEGFALAGAGEITGATRRGADDGEAPGGPLTMYGPSTDDPQLGIAVVAGWDGTAAEADGVEAVELGGRTAYRYDGMGLGKRTLLVPDGDRAILIASPTLDADEVEALATVVTADDDGNVDLHGFDLPDGWEQIGRVPDLLGAASPMTATANASSTGTPA